jgi:hypothetical protein
MIHRLQGGQSLLVVIPAKKRVDAEFKRSQDKNSI